MSKVADAHSAACCLFLPLHLLTPIPHDCVAHCPIVVLLQANNKEQGLKLVLNFLVESTAFLRAMCGRDR